MLIGNSAVIKYILVELPKIIEKVFFVFLIYITVGYF